MALVLGLATTGCTAASGEQHAKPRVVATTSILRDVVSRVAGDNAEVTGLMRPGIDPHTFEPSLRDTRDIAYADAVFTSGLLLEPQSVTSTIASTARPGAPVVAVSEEAQREGFAPIPLVEDAGLDTVWLGMRVDGDIPGDAAGTAVVDLALTGAEGPGDAAAFVLGTFGTPEVIFSTRDGLGSDDSITLPTAAHTHVSWSFSAPGVYHLRLAATTRESAKAPSAVYTSEETFTVVVGTDPATVTPGKKVLGTGHVDITTLAGESGRLTLRGDGPAEGSRMPRDTNVEYNPGEAVIAVPTTTLQTIPAQREFRFLGTPGDETYLLPQAVLGKHVHGELDPHFWHDVSAIKAVVNVVRDELAAVDPAHSGSYAANARSYREQLDSLDAEVHAQVDSIPPERRNLVTTHDGYAYLGAAYGLRIAGFVTPNPSVEPSPRDLLALTRTLENLHVPAVFLEPELAGKSSDLQQTAHRLGIRVCPIRGDSLDPPGTGPATTYVELMRANAASISECLA
nr:anchored repeat ABC transporter, substrate-binding protein [Corynebacterium capitovis]